MRPATQNIGYFYAICYFADRFSFAHFLLDELCGVALMIAWLETDPMTAKSALDAGYDDVW